LAPLLAKTVETTGVLLWRMAGMGRLVSEDGAYAVAQRADGQRRGDRSDGERARP